MTIKTILTDLSVLSCSTTVQLSGILKFFQPNRPPSSFLSAPMAQVTSTSRECNQTLWKHWDIVSANDDIATVAQHPQGTRSNPYHYQLSTQAAPQFWKLVIKTNLTHTQTNPDVLTSINSKLPACCHDTVVPRHVKHFSCVKSSLLFVWIV